MFLLLIVGIIIQKIIVQATIATGEVTRGGAGVKNICAGVWVQKMSVLLLLFQTRIVHGKQEEQAGDVREKAAGTLIVLRLNVKVILED